MKRTLATSRNYSMKAVAQYLSEIGTKGGNAKSDAKTKAARKNGKKGGRPKGSKNKPKAEKAA